MVLRNLWTQTYHQTINESDPSRGLEIRRCSNKVPRKRVRLACKPPRVRSQNLAQSSMEIWSWNYFYCHSLSSADSRRAVVSYWRKNVHQVLVNCPGTVWLGNWPHPKWPKMCWRAVKQNQTKPKHVEGRTALILVCRFTFTYIAIWAILWQLALVSSRKRINILQYPFLLSHYAAFQ